jgi:NAD(P)-dependent dehydrogenase (short-subunit alcohol dehydrogenase family)
VVAYLTAGRAAEQVVRQITAHGDRAFACQADVAASGDRDTLVDATLSTFRRIDLLVNNAGMAPRRRADILTTTEESYDEVMSVNLKGPFFLTQRVAREMIALVQAGVVSSPKIINVGSLSAYASSVARPEYCLSKAGVGMMTALYADRLAGEGINVYEVRPGIIATDMTAGVRARYDRLIEEGLTPIARWGSPDDVARAVVAIADDMLPFSTGEVINVDGGFHLHRL